MKRGPEVDGHPHKTADVTAISGGLSIDRSLSRVMASARCLRPGGCRVPMDPMLAGSHNMGGVMHARSHRGGRREGMPDCIRVQCTAQQEGCRQKQLQDNAKGSANAGHAICISHQPPLDN